MLNGVYTWFPENNVLVSMVQQFNSDDLHKIILESEGNLVFNTNIKVQLWNYGIHPT